MYKLLELINSSAKLQNAKSTLKTPVVFLNTNKSQTEEILKTIPFSIAPESIKYLRITPPRR